MHQGINRANSDRRLDMCGPTLDECRAVPVAMPDNVRLVNPESLLVRAG